MKIQDCVIFIMEIVLLGYNLNWEMTLPPATHLEIVWNLFYVNFSTYIRKILLSF